MKLLAKFNLLLIVVFGLGLALIAINARSFLLQDAKETVLAQAKLMAASSKATRDYTDEEISPILESTPEHKNDFLPQTIPFFAAETSFRDVQKQFPDYAYKEAALNPTNPADHATDWEADIINTFQKDSSLKEFTTVGTWDGIADEIVAKYGGVATRVVSYFTGSDVVHDPGAFERWGVVARAVRTVSPLG